jgi:hypothetical protein
MPQPVNNSQRLARNRVLIGGLMLYACAFAILLRNKSFDAAGAVVVLVVFGIVFPLLAWIATRRAIPLSISVKPGQFQLIVLIGYIIILSVYLVGGPQWIDQHLPDSWIDSARIKFFITLAKKLIVFVAIPFAIFRFGFGISEFSARVCVRFATVICPLSWLLEALLSLSNIFSAEAALHFGRDTLPSINCFLVCRFASFGFSLKPD